ncbi:hypothetical protein predicted by Glimmer/Critica [Bdellovibrio bacteriovorus HD100]|uniref:Uncharacterized protein n=1 Tax=Bdellovibrio bacteriovorus (strain ATCC 15356 / DSM 50701 / NCIMB 9529 / HD100) TaxID=264462 RepID=Q6MRP7_BDEBA|nr:hypothetical protein predicted by Glimmer/Critica [Bdellovibrio bacteriovorus HD100]
MEIPAHHWTFVWKQLDFEPKFLRNLTTIER